MVGWHHRLDGHEFERAPGVGDGQGSLACCSPRGRKQSDIIEHSVQLLSPVQLFVTPWTAARQASLSITNSWSLLKLHRVSDAIQPSHPLSSPSTPALNLSQHQGLFQ